MLRYVLACISLAIVGCVPATPPVVGALVSVDRELAQLVADGACDGGVDEGSVQRARDDLARARRAEARGDASDQARWLARARLDAALASSKARSATVHAALLRTEAERRALSEWLSKAQEAKR
jgi:hypothetical protein